jgi:hypothetical protein
MIAPVLPELPNLHARSGTAQDEISHLPRTLEALQALPDDVKIMLAAATASGCDAVAFYTPARGNGFEREKEIALYPGIGNVFAEHIDQFDGKSFADETAVIRNASYHIPVYAQDQLKGIIVLHAPTADYSRVQTEAEKTTAFDVHEPAGVRKAKLEMAAHIVARHQDLFGFSGQRLKETEKRHRTIDEKIEYFSEMAKDLFSTLPLENGGNIYPAQVEAVRNARNADELKTALRQVVSEHKMAEGAHLLGVADMMRLSIDAINGDAQPPVINEKQAYLIELLTLLHDVGKSQMSSTFFRHWASPVSKQEQTQRERYATAHNHNHPLFTLLTELIYGPEGVMNAAHHQSFGRYTQDELKEKMGANYKDFNLLNDDIPQEKLPILSKIMRIADVTEAASDGERADLPLDKLLHSLAEKAGYDATTKTIHDVALNARTVDADSLCFLIDSGVFDHYGKLRESEKHATGHAKGWWSDVDNCPKYNPAKLKQVQQEILTAFGWQEKKERVAKQLREQVAADPVIRENPPPEIGDITAVRSLFGR